MIELCRCIVVVAIRFDSKCLTNVVKGLKHLQLPSLIYTTFKLRVQMIPLVVFKPLLNFVCHFHAIRQTAPV